MNNWIKNIDVFIEQIYELEKQLEIKLPSSYKEFLIRNGAGEGYQNDFYLSLWSIKDLLSLNNDYQIHKYLTNDFLAFGTDGGSNCFLFNIKNNFKIYICSLGDLDIKELKFISDDFYDIVRW